MVGSTIQLLMEDTTMTIELGKVTAETKQASPPPVVDNPNAIGNFE